MNRAFWRGRRVFVTGHTGFKGGWLSLWLNHLGAEVHGYALDAPTEPSFFNVTRLADLLASHTIADIRDGELLRRSMLAARPQIVFHLAAQPLVRRSYVQPVETYSVNVMGTVNLLEAVRATPGIRAVVLVTSDKCYENREWFWGYREDEPMGGFDPYSSSKGCAELICSAYRRSYFSGDRYAEHGVSLASARAGNVIGGGDWADDRLVPDFFRELDAGRSLSVRSPGALRPWQHVLEPLAGYMSLSQRQVESGPLYGEAWNFGPADDDTRSVAWVLDQLSRRCMGALAVETVGETLHEARVLKLDSSKARARLGWAPRWHLEDAIEQTVVWHSAWKQGKDMRAVTLDQVVHYESLLTSN